MHTCTHKLVEDEGPVRPVPDRSGWHCVALINMDTTRQGRAGRAAALVRRWKERVPAGQVGSGCWAVCLAASAGQAPRQLGAIEVLGSEDRRTHPDLLA